MKIAVIGGGGVRTPLIIEAAARRARQMPIAELALMDTDAERLDLMRELVAGGDGDLPFRLLWTTEPAPALDGASFVITTFRVGGISSRVVDERVPLAHGVLGQETTGPGGFALAMRSIPVLLHYLELMRQACPSAWLVNFANPAGLLAQAATQAGWERTVGICDGPAAMRRVAASVLRAPLDELFLDYFGLNHLGWVRAVWYNGHDHLSELIAMLRRGGGMPGLPFSPELITGLGMIPNEYLFYYYHSQDAVQNIRRAGRTRGEQIATWNSDLMAELRALRSTGSGSAMRLAYERYLRRRNDSYMAAETGRVGEILDSPTDGIPESEGYAGVALDLIEGLSGLGPREMVLNVPNRGSIAGMAAADVVEVPAFVGKDLVRPLAVGSIPPQPLGLMQQVKAYELLTIEAAISGSYDAAARALAIHPLVRDYGLAKIIVDEYRAAYGPLFPSLDRGDA